MNKEELVKEVAKKANVSQKTRKSKFLCIFAKRNTPNSVMVSFTSAL